MVYHSALECKDTNWFKGKGQERIYQANTTLKRTEGVICILYGDPGFPEAGWLRCGFLGSKWRQDTQPGWKIVGAECHAEELARSRQQSHCWAWKTWGWHSLETETQLGKG